MPLNILDARVVLDNLPLDDKLCNYYVDDDSNIVIESISDYLGMYDMAIRAAGVPITLLIDSSAPTPADSLGGVYSSDDFRTALANYDVYYYTFIGGIADVNFVPIPTTDVSTGMSIVGNGRKINPIVLVNDASIVAPLKYYGTGDITDASKGYHLFPDQFTCMTVTGTGKEDDCIHLINDEIDPNILYYYGTDASGTKGYWPFPVVTVTQVQWIPTDYRYCQLSGTQNTGWEWVEEKRQLFINELWVDDTSTAYRLVLKENLTSCPLVVTEYRWINTDVSMCDVVGGLYNGYKLYEKKQQYSTDNITWYDSLIPTIFQRLPNATECPIPLRTSYVYIGQTYDSNVARTHEFSFTYGKQVNIPCYSVASPPDNYLFISIPAATINDFAVTDGGDDITSSFGNYGTDTRFGYVNNTIWQCTPMYSSKYIATPKLTIF